MRNKHFLPAYIFGALIIIAASLPTESLNKFQKSNILFEIILSDYVLHFFALGIFAALLCYGFYRRGSIKFSYLRSGLFSFLFGLSVEFYQYFLPYRTFALNDLLSDLAGISVALVLCYIWIANRKLKKITHGMKY